MAPKPDNPNLVGPSPIVRALEEEWRHGNTIVLTGFLDGPYFERGMKDEWDDYRFRLYNTLALDSYIEFRWGDVRWIVNYSDPDPNPPKPTDTDVLKRVTIWIDHNAKVTIPGFLAGDIADQFMPLEDSVVSLARSPRDIDAIFAARSGAGCSTKPACTCFG